MTGPAGTEALTPEQVRHLLSECVTVIQPGETLVIRGRNWTPNQVREIQDWLDTEHATGRITFKALAVPGDELAVTQEPDFMNRVREEPLHGTDVLKIRLTHQPSGITVVARDRPEAIVKLRHALTGAARRQADLQETARRQEREAEQALRRGSDCPEHGEPLLWLGDGNLACPRGHNYQIPDTPPPAKPSRRRTPR